MDGLIYQVVIKTPEGYRVGELSVNIKNGEIYGEMNLLDFGAYKGTIDQDGNISVCIKLANDFSPNCYIGFGKMSFYSIHIFFRCDGFVYEINGIINR